MVVAGSVMRSQRRAAVGSGHPGRRKHVEPCFVGRPLWTVEYLPAGPLALSVRTIVLRIASDEELSRPSRPRSDCRQDRGNYT